jgi:3-dehydroquinate synthase
MNELVYLIGFSGTGKSSVARLIAQALRWSFIDMDEEIESSCGKSISEIFQTKGEKWFRDEESKLLNNISVKNKHIISTGGGVPVKDQNMNLMLKTGYVICLDASVDQIVARLSILDGKDNKLSDRPKITNLSVEDISNFKSERANIYSMANFTINTNHLTVEQVTNELLKSINKFLNKLNVIEWQKIDDFCTSVENINNIYPVYVGFDLYEKLPQMLKPFLIKHKVFLLADDGSKLYMRKIQKLFELNKIKTTTLVLNSGEQSKSLENTSSIYEWLSSEHADRDDILLGIGGGMVGDISGYVAATYMRGIKFVLIPTTLLSISDSSIGGKTAIDVNNIKNLVGSFHAPSLVVSDLLALDTLPQRQINSGWAELIKHGFIKDRELLDQMMDIKDFNYLNEELISIIKKSIKIKADIVSVDENEKYGQRILLNYGHTVGHAIEASTNLNKYTHGEAVSLGMVFAAKLSNKLGLLSDDDYNFHIQILNKFNLPTDFKDINWENCFDLIKNDKKVKDGKINWVLLKSLGNSFTKNDISEDILMEIVREQ